ncbi:hypothetical protein L7F22_037640 [Adiantum nelumboides]|nr:hypothetical protein [Adiantum nelumboides]
MFTAFKKNFSTLLRNQIEPHWKEFECSLLSPLVMKRAQHRREVEKEKRKQKDESPASEICGEPLQPAHGMMTARERTYLDASLFWEVGDGSLEPYVPPVIREKIKTQKQGSTDAKMKDTGSRSEELQMPGDSPPSRPLDQLKNSVLRLGMFCGVKEKGV